MNLRVSASQINVFLNEPAIWVLNKRFKVYGEMGPEAKLGIAVEKGLESVLFNDFTFDAALAWAYDVFDKDTINMADRENVSECRSRISPMLEEAVNVFLNLGEPLGSQIEVTGQIEGVDVLGFADFDYGDFYIDLKTSRRCPSSADTLSSEHLRQLTIYKILTGKTQKIAYFTGKKSNVFEPSERQFKIAEFEIRNAIRAMKHLWEMTEEDMVTLCPPRAMGSFWWDDITIKEANRIWR